MCCIEIVAVCCIEIVAVCCIEVPPHTSRLLQCGAVCCSVAQRVAVCCRCLSEIAIPYPKIVMEVEYVYIFIHMQTYIYTTFHTTKYSAFNHFFLSFFRTPPNVSKSNCNCCNKRTNICQRRRPLKMHSAVSLKGMAKNENKTAATSAAL